MPLEGPRVQRVGPGHMWSPVCSHLEESIKHIMSSLVFVKVLSKTMVLRYEINQVKRGMQEVHALRHRLNLIEGSQWAG